MSTLGIENIEHTNGTSAIAINSDGVVAQPTKPVFQAFGIAGGTYAHGSHVILPSDTVNVGSHYDNTTGRFTVPIAGTYFFTWSFLGNTASNTYRYYLYKNGSELDGGVHVRLIGTGSQYAENATGNWIGPAVAGDYFNIYYHSDNGTTATYPGGNTSLPTTTAHYSKFGGYLIG